MSLSATWNSDSAWALWTSSLNSPRIYGDSIKLPFNSISGFSGSIKALWEIGNNQSLNDSSGVPPTSSLQETIGDPISATQIAEEGLLSPTRNGYVSANISKLGYPTTDLSYIGVWFKSNISDYSEGRGYILIYSIGINDGEIGYAIFVDSDNRIKAAIKESGSTTILSPVGGDVIIDENWHLAILIPGITGSSTLAGLIVDNEQGTPVSVTPQAIGGSPTFTIGSNTYDSFYGFSGIIDEPVIAQFSGPIDWGSSFYRFSSSSFYSPVVDTEKDDSVILEMKSDYETPDNSSLIFYFRSSNTSFSQMDLLPNWSPGIFSSTITSGDRINLKQFGIYQTGRYFQVKVDFLPSDDSLKLSTPSISSLSLNCGVKNKLLASAMDVLDKGNSLHQIINFSGSKKIDKVALDLTVVDDERKEFFVGKNGVVSFSAANFQNSYKSWFFQTVAGSWESSSVTLSPVSFNSENSPYLQYKIYLDESGEYDLWGYGYTDTGTILWSWDFDNSDLREVTLSNDGSYEPGWVKFGTISVKEGGLYTFTVYLGESGILLLDQWYFTNKAVVGFPLTSPWSVSAGPFMTAVRLQSITNDLPNGNDKLISWLSSTEINASGRFNYLIRTEENNGKEYTDGLSMEFFQVGGDEKFFAAWNYSFVTDENSVGKSLISTNYGSELHEPIVR